MVLGSVQRVPQIRLVCSVVQAISISDRCVFLEPNLVVGDWDFVHARSFVNPPIAIEDFQPILGYYRLGAGISHKVLRK